MPFINKLLLEILILIVLPLPLLAQDITGVWTGYIHTTGTQLPYELVISETKGGFTGYAMTIFTINGVENIGIKTVQLKNKNRILSLEDETLIYNNYSTPPKRSKLFATLYITAGGSIMMMSGDFTTRSLDFRDKNSYSGSIQLQRQSNQEQSKLMAKLRELNLLNTLSFTQTKAVVKEEKTKSVASVKKAPPVQPEEKKETVVVNPVYDEETEDFTPKKKVSPPAVTYVQAPKPSSERKEKQQQTELVSKTTPDNNKPVVSDSKVKDKQTETPVLKTAIVAGPSAAEIAARKTEIIRDVFFTSDSLILSLYDNGTVDGDTVSVVLNGRVIIPRKGLTTQAIREIIHITPEMGDSLQLIMYAENLGSIPPNTGLLIVQDGNERHEIRFEGDMKKSSAVILRRKIK
ncbi:MAG: hypothetical protein ICV53_09385 [Flavisolibacter sp.]|nr:hypothetical protein [Flavisolibacter sp.]